MKQRQEWLLTMINYNPMPEDFTLFMDKRSIRALDRLISKGLVNAPCSHEPRYTATLDGMAQAASIAYDAEKKG